MDSSEELLKARKMCVIDGCTYSSRIYRENPKYILPNPTGIYLKNNPIPIMVAGQCYYRESDYYKLLETVDPVTGIPHSDVNIPYITKKFTKPNNIVPLVNLDGVNENVVDSKGNVVINAFVANHANKFLSNTSNVSYYALMLLKYFISSHMSSISPYEKRDRYNSGIYSCLTEEGAAALDKGELDLHAYFSEVLELVDEFIGEDVWNIHFIKSKGRDIIIEQAADFRIYQWTKMVEQGEIEF